MSRADRQRRYRQRIRWNRRVFRFEADEFAVIGLLIEAGFLPEHKSTDDREVSRALAAFVSSARAVMISSDR